MQVQLGRYQNRISRIVDIHSSRWQDERQHDGTLNRVRVWTGTMYKADGRTPDSDHDWNDLGAFRNQRGVASQYDLTILIEAKGGEPSPADPELAAAKQQIAQLTVQLDAVRGAAYIPSGGLAQAMVHADPSPQKQGDYAWSAAYQEVLELRRNYGSAITLLCGLESKPPQVIAFLDEKAEEVAGLEALEATATD